MERMRVEHEQGRENGLYFVDSSATNHEKRLSDKPFVHPSAAVIKSELGVYTDIGPYCSLYESSLGHYSYAAKAVSILWSTIGNFCSLASHVTVNPGNHPSWRVTQHHCTYRRKQYGFAESDDEEFFQWRKNSWVTIGHDVWLGHGVTVLPGSSIATGAVVGAGSVVTKSHPVNPYEIVVGAPAQPLQKRFSDTIIEKLLTIAYWNWDRKTLEKRFHYFNDINIFIENFG